MPSSYFDALEPWKAGDRRGAGDRRARFAARCTSPGWSARRSSQSFRRGRDLRAAGRALGTVGGAAPHRSRRRRLAGARERRARAAAFDLSLAARPVRDGTARCRRFATTDVAAPMQQARQGVAVLLQPRRIGKCASRRARNTHRVGSSGSSGNRRAYGSVSARCVYASSCVATLASRRQRRAGTGRGRRRAAASAAQIHPGMQRIGHRKLERRRARRSRRRSAGSRPRLAGAARAKANATKT